MARMRPRILAGGNPRRRRLRVLLRNDAHDELVYAQGYRIPHPHEKRLSMPVKYADLIYQIQEVRSHKENETVSWKMRFLFLDIIVIEKFYMGYSISKDHKVRNQFFADHSFN